MWRPESHASKDQKWPPLTTSQTTPAHSCSPSSSSANCHSFRWWRFLRRSELHWCWLLLLLRSLRYVFEYLKRYSLYWKKVIKELGTSCIIFWGNLVNYHFITVFWGNLFNYHFIFLQDVDYYDNAPTATPAPVRRPVTAAPTR